MYTKLDDKEMAIKIIQYLVDNPNATQKEICQQFRTNERRLNQLEEEHLINISHTRRQHGTTTSTQE
jgi:DNA-directed RNA polymerase sigma subunit (sigma70/sigma32)